MIKSALLVEEEEDELLLTGTPVNELSVIADFAGWTAPFPCWRTVPAARAFFWASRASIEVI